jgi:polysaccharide export outer membrane protein
MFQTGFIQKYNLRPVGLMGLLLACTLLGFVGCKDLKSRESNLYPEEEVFMKSDSFSFDTEEYPAKDGLFAAYQLGPGDVLDVLFHVKGWDAEGDTFYLATDHEVVVTFVEVPKLNITQKVKPNGMISLPYAGDIKAVGKTIKQLTQEIKEAYKDILKDPIQMYVTVPDYSTRIQEFKKDLHTASRGLSRLATIRPDGFCTFPVVGDIKVANRTIPDVNKELDKLYSKQLAGISVNLFLERSGGSSIYVLGSIAKPGAYTITRPVTILQCIAMAGGGISGSNFTKVVVFRQRRSGSLAKTNLSDKTDKKTQTLEFTKDKVRCVDDAEAAKSTDENAVAKAPKREGKNGFSARAINVQAALVDPSQATAFYLMPNDILYIPKSDTFHAAEVMEAARKIIWFRGWGINLDYGDATGTNN